MSISLSLSTVLPHPRLPVPRLVPSSPRPRPARSRYPHTMTVSVVSTAAPSSSRRAVVLHAKGRNSRARTGDYNRSSSRRRRADGDDDDDASAIERLESSARSSRSSAYDAKKLAKVRARARTEAREEEAARAAFDTKYAARQRQGLPQVVTDRMLKRVGVFCGTPLIFGFATGPAFYYAKAVRGIDVPSWVFFTASTATFGAAVVGISYGVLSASWDPRREGSFWGFAEFKENVPIVVSTIMGKARGEVPLEWDDETDEDF